MGVGCVAGGGCGHGAAQTTWGGMGGQGRPYKHRFCRFTRAVCKIYKGRLLRDCALYMQCLCFGTFLCKIYKGVFLRDCSLYTHIGFDVGVRK